MADLRDVGLSKYEARAYRSLLESGPTTAKTLSEASGVPMGRVYDVLNSLEQHRLVRSQAASRPKKYVAVEPETALDRLLDEKRRDLQRQERQYEETVAELTDELESGEPADEQFWTAAVGSEETADLLLERLAAADDQIVVISSTTTSGSEVQGTVTLVDDNETCLEVPNPVERGSTLAMIDLKDGSFAADVRNRFEDRWAEAEPFSFDPATE